MTMPNKPISAMTAEERAAWKRDAMHQAQVDEAERRRAAVERYDRVYNEQRLAYETNILPVRDAFLDELRALCVKYGVCLASHEDPILVPLSDDRITYFIDSLRQNPYPTLPPSAQLVVTK